MASTSLKNKSGNGIPVGHRSTFAQILKKYHAATNPLTKWAYRDILEKRMMNALKNSDTPSFTKFTKMLMDI